MPKQSDRKLLIHELDKTLKELARDGQESTREFTEILEIAQSLSSCRYLYPRCPVPKCDGWKEIFWSFPDGDFRQMVRMDQVSFLRLLSKIEDHPIFHNASFFEQEKVWIQLAVALNRLGCCGNGISIGRVARFHGYSTGSVFNFTERVITAIVSLIGQYVYWPDAEQRRRIAQRFLLKHGLYKCVGVVDGTPVIFSLKPAECCDPETFYDRYLLLNQLVSIVRTIIFNLLNCFGDD
jgi:hypothetical protein